MKKRKVIILTTFNLEELIEKDKSVREKLEQLQRSAREAKSLISTKTGKYLMKCFEEANIAFTSNEDIWAVVGAVVQMQENNARSQAIIKGKTLCEKVDIKNKSRRKKVTATPEETGDNLDTN